MTMQRSDASDKVLLAFPTPIYQVVRHDMDAINAGLLRLALEREKAAPSTARSNVGGWQSGPDLLSWPGPEIEQLRAWINESFGEIMKVAAGTTAFRSRLSVTAWANLNRRGDYNRSHTHSTNHWSGVYYVDPGDDVDGRPLSGAIEFIDPRPAVNVYDIPGIQQASTWTVRPEAGLMLLFPSWLRHGVLPYEGATPRLTIAFNIRVNELERAPA